MPTIPIIVGLTMLSLVASVCMGLKIAIFSFYFSKDDDGKGASRPVAFPDEVIIFRNQVTGAIVYTSKRNPG